MIPAGYLDCLENDEKATILSFSSSTQPKEKSKGYGRAVVVEGEGREITNWEVECKGFIYLFLSQKRENPIHLAIVHLNC